MIYTGHLPASGDSFYVSVARSCNDPLSLCPPEPGRLSFREICRPRPQPIRSSAAPVKFTRQVYMAVSCVTRRGLLLVSRRVRGEKLSSSQVQGVSVSRGNNEKKTKRRCTRRTRRTSKRRKRTERSSGAGYTQVRERAFLSVPLGFLATSGSKTDV